MSLLSFYACTKDSKESGILGEQIIGNYQILQTAPEKDEFCYWGNIYSKNSVGQSLFSYWEAISKTNVRGTVNFSADLEGYYDI